MPSAHCQILLHIVFSSELPGMLPIHGVEFDERHILD